MYIAWAAGSQIKFVKSSDGGTTFSAPAVAASGITNLESAGLNAPDGFTELPLGTFRVETIVTACAGSTGEVVIAWADYREQHSQIYFCTSADGGATWLGAPSGKPLFTSAISQHDFQPQLAATPRGEIGCAFYEFGPKGGSEFPPQLIDAYLAVSIDNGVSFKDRVLITERPWDPTLDAPLSHGSPHTTFIGDYFGLAASRLGFFPLFLSTITGVQEMFTSRISVYPADLYIRDSSSDVGDVPSPGNHWEAPDLIVRQQPDGDVTFVNQDLLRDGVTDHYIYGRVTNRGPNDGRNVRLAVTVALWHQGMPGTEFRYPQDWYEGNYGSIHLNLGVSLPASVQNGATKIIGPVVFPATQIPAQGSYHTCLLAEVQTDNDDSAGGTHGCGIQIDPDPCSYGSYFWGNNNICQRNLSYQPVRALSAVPLQFQFIVGSIWSTSRFLEISLENPPKLVDTLFTLKVEPFTLPSPTLPNSPCSDCELIFTSHARVIIRCGNCDVGEIEAKPGTTWRSICKHAVHGHQTNAQDWQIAGSTPSISFPVKAQELRLVTLSFTTPKTLKRGEATLLRIYQKNDQRIIAGSVFLELDSK